MIREHRDCVVVGGGPAGLVFAYLAARRGLKVTVLEIAKDFNRQFRGDTLNPLTLTFLEQMGLVDEVLALPHSKVDTLYASADKAFIELSYKRLKSKYPYVMILSQPIFLNFLVEKASAHPNFELKMRARVTGLLEEDGGVAGVTYKDAEGNDYELRAPLTLGADGRSSATRKFSGLKTVNLSKRPDEVIWFNMPIKKGDPEEGLVARENARHSVFMFRRPTEWQIGLTLLKDKYQTFKDKGLEHFHSEMEHLLPEFKTRIQATTWQDTAYLKVELKRAERWYKKGLLLIGDAAHVMSPIGGIGINLAIRDAVVAANTLLEPLSRGVVKESDLAKVQRKVGWEIRLLQAFQVTIQNAGYKNEENPNDKVIGLPKIFRDGFLSVPLVRDLPVKLLAFGMVRVRLEGG
jgi:2-polyprenyl-6-methoxyphenol hydroxylase-like FAD-dependent oxidoreductase